MTINFIIKKFILDLAEVPSALYEYMKLQENK